MTKPLSQATRKFCRRVTELARADSLVARCVAGRDVAEMMILINGAGYDVGTWLEYTRQVTANAIEQAGREMGGIPIELKKWDFEL